ncbi:MAG: hypothetical protein ABSC41_08945 [Acidimicrobiales bacterium]
MTVLDRPRALPQTDEAQLLFQEAKQRRKRRWLISGITTLVLLGVIVATLGLTSGGGGGGLPKPVVAPVSATGPGHPAANLSFRPVLCYAPPLTLAAGQAASTGALPACSASAALTASNLQVAPDSGNVNGYEGNTNIPADPHFATYPSTPPNEADGNDSVLLPGIAAEGSGRYVLGPASLDQRGVKSASAHMVNGQWTVNLVLTPAGATAWDTLTKQQFHGIIGIDLNGKVISAPITQPTQSAWTSFNGQMQISGSFTGQQARAIAAEL